MTKTPKVKQPWDIRIITENRVPEEHTVEIKVSFKDNNLRNKMSKINNSHFTVNFSSYWFKKGIKSAHVYKTDRPTKTSQPYSSYMKYTFDSPVKAALFSQGIERALDLFIMENILEDKRKSESVTNIKNERSEPR